MSKIKLTGHASGSGTLTISAPNTSTDRTITLPDETTTLSTVTTIGGLTDVSMDIANFTDSLLIQTNSDGSAPTTGTLNSATNNIGIGKNVFKVLTDGDYNTAIGADAMDALTTGTYNVALGSHAPLGALTTGHRNIAIGGGSLLVATDNHDCIGIGIDTLTAAANVAGHTGNQNIAIGSYAGNAITKGDLNICLGYQAGDDITTGSNNIVIGNICDAGGATRENGIVLGHNIDSGANNQFRFGKASNRVYNEFDTDAAWTRSSDQRLKTNIANATLGLDFVNDLRPVTYKWKASQDLDSSDSQLAKLYDPDKNLMNTGVTMHGLIAQEVKTALDTAGVSTFGGWDEDEDGVQSISREMFVIPLIKAIQELSAENTDLKARLTAGGL